MNSFTYSSLSSKQSLILKISLIVVLVPLVAYAGLRATYYNRIFPNTYVGSLAVGGLTYKTAEAKISARLLSLGSPGLPLEYVQAEGQAKETVALAVTGDAKILADQAYGYGRTNGFLARLGVLANLVGKKTELDGNVGVESGLIKAEIDNLAILVDQPIKDVRLHVTGSRVEVLTDTRPGRVLDKAWLEAAIQNRVKDLSLEPIAVKFVEAQPVVDIETANAAKDEAELIIKDTLALTDRGQTYYISRTTLGSWIINAVEGSTLRAGLDREAISAYVAQLSIDLNEPATDLGVKVENDVVVDFIPPQPGRVIEEDKAIELIIQALEDRRQEKSAVKEIVLPVVVKEAAVIGNATELGIKELIGRASTRFTGSPKNRIANIKNGVKFLSGRIVKPGETFSTIGALGTIDNTTGYLPELVIRGNRTVPEFGGGLCQVSTTLFRAVMNSSLPITERQNHSYRVIYYEKDGEGKFIGPGLDATIYDPKPDFKFTNNTATSVLITGYVLGDRVTFELYGTKDGRSSTIDGPHTLTTTPSGEPIYTKTEELEPGVQKQIEKPHPGGTAIATYTITYADGTTAESVYRSYYRPWPAQFLVGVEPGSLDKPTEPAPTDSTSPQTSSEPVVAPPPSQP